MATRFYLSQAEPAEVSVTPDAAWEVTSSPAIQRRIVTHKRSSDTIATIAAFTSTTGQDRLHYQGVSDPLPAGITFDTGVTYKCYVQTLMSAANDNCRSRLGVRIVSEDGTTVRHTVLAVADYSTAANWNTALRNKSFANGDAGTGSYVTVAGDRLVIEIGHNDAAGASISSSSRYGFGSTTDLGENETDTTATLAPWFETSATFNILMLYEDFEVSPDNTTLSIANTHAATVTSTAVSDSGIVPSGLGTFAMLCTATGATKSMTLSWGIDTDWYCRFYVYLDVYPAASSTLVDLWNTNAVARTGDVQIGTTGLVRLRNQALTLIDTSTTVLALDTWHRIELHQTTTRFEARIFAGSNLHGTTPDEDEVALGGVVAHSGTAELRIGVNNAVTWNVSIDDFVYRSDTWVGPGLTSVTPTTVAGVAAVPTPTVETPGGAVDADVFPTTIAAITAVSVPTIEANADTTTATIAASGAVDTPSVSATTAVGLPTLVMAAHRAP